MFMFLVYLLVSLFVVVHVKYIDLPSIWEMHFANSISIIIIVIIVVSHILLQLNARNLC